MDIFDIISIAILACCVAINYIRYNDVVYPPVIMSSCWLVVLWLYCLNKGTYSIVSIELYYIIIIGVVLFSAGSAIATHETKTILNNNILLNAYNNPISKLYFYISLIMLPSFAYRAYLLSMSGPSDSLIFNLRYVLTDDSSTYSFGLYAYLVPLSIISSLIQLLINKYENNSVILCLSIITTVSYCLLSSGRQSLFIFVLSAYSLLIYSKRVSLYKSVPFVFIFCLVIYISIAVSLNKGISLDDNFISQVNSMFNEIKLYAIGALPAFDTYLNKELIYDNGLNTFRSVFSFFNAMGIDFKVVSLVQDFVNVPFPTNVYTIYQPYYLDFGIYGIIIAQLFFGFVHGSLYKRLAYSNYSLLLISLLNYPLIFQFFEDQYMSLLSTWIQYLLLILLYFKFNKKHDDVQCNLS